MLLPLLSTKAHGVIDYVTAATLLALPSKLGLGEAPVARKTLRRSGVLLALQSLVTDYELSLANLVPVRAHLALDALSGAGLAAAPWLSGDSKRGPKAWAPHLAIGGMEIAVALVTRPERGR